MTVGDRLFDYRGNAVQVLQVRSYPQSGLPTPVKVAYATGLEDWLLASQLRTPEQVLQQAEDEGRPVCRNAKCGRYQAQLLEANQRMLARLQRLEAALEEARA